MRSRLYSIRNYYIIYAISKCCYTTPDPNLKRGDYAAPGLRESIFFIVKLEYFK